MSETQFGRLQFRIMQVLWDRGRVSAREITEALNAGEPVAHSTVQTIATHKGSTPDQRYANDVPRLLEDLQEDIKSPAGPKPFSQP